MTVEVGTSGWSYDHWQGVLYPDGTRPVDRLALYTGRFRTVELNSSFYRWPRESAFARWRDRLPAGFRFSVKAPRGLTHAKRLYAPEAWVERIRRCWHGRLVLGAQTEAFEAEFAAVAGSGTPSRRPPALSRWRSCTAPPARPAGPRWLPANTNYATALHARPGPALRRRPVRRRPAVDAVQDAPDQHGAGPTSRRSITAGRLAMTEFCAPTS